MVLRGGWLFFWRVHFGLALAATVALAWWMFAGIGTTRLTEVSAMNPRQLAASFTPLLVVLGLLIAEGGLIAQAAIEKRSFWRALFLGIAALSAFVALRELPVFEQFVDDLQEGDRAVGLIAAVVLAGQLWSLWLYAYRSDHLWDPLEAGASGD